MKRFKGTQGPWYVREIELHEGGNGVEVVAGDGEVICDNQTYYPQAINPKNAALIAAAPKLLDAAIMAIEHYDAYFEGFEPPEDLPWVPVMREAIKEALGEDAL